MHFSSFGATINSNLIVSAITCHGIPVFHTSEMLLKSFISRDSACNLADIIAVYKNSERFHIVGIEIKEWDKRVHQKLAAEYLETYRHTCEYFYLAANRFSKRTLALKDIGLFDLTGIKVIKNPLKFVRLKSHENTAMDCTLQLHVIAKLKPEFDS